MPSGLAIGGEFQSMLGELSAEARGFQQTKSILRLEDTAPPCFLIINRSENPNSDYVLSAIATEHRDQVQTITTALSDYRVGRIGLEELQRIVEQTKAVFASNAEIVSGIQNEYDQAIAYVVNIEKSAMVIL